MVELPAKPTNQLKPPLFQNQTQTQTTAPPPETDMYVNCHECGGYIHKDRLGLLLRKRYFPNYPIIETPDRVFCDTDCFCRYVIKEEERRELGYIDVATNY
jgi:hypothetical protein